MDSVRDGLAVDGGEEEEVEEEEEEDEEEEFDPSAFMEGEERRGEDLAVMRAEWSEERNDGCIINSATVGRLF